MQSIKENAIQEYILKKTDFSNEDNISIKQIKEDLKRILGEEPAVQLNWQKDGVLNEITGEAKEINKVKSINIIFTDTNNEYKSLEFLI